jgi:hypothetical protein
MPAAESTTSLEISNPVPGTLPSAYQCPQCSLSFDKAYLLKYPPRSFSTPSPTLFSQNTYSTKPTIFSKHITRKHERRYKCNDCDSAFSLRADLLRHQRVRHRRKDAGSGANAGANAAELFVCSNPSCKTPGKTFNRKDNLMRHETRCAASAGASASATGSSEASPQPSYGERGGDGRRL